MYICYGDNATIALAILSNTHICKLQAKACIFQSGAQGCILCLLDIIEGILAGQAGNQAADRFGIAPVQKNLGLKNCHLVGYPQCGQLHASLGMGKAEPELLITQIQLHQLFLRLFRDGRPQKLQRVKARHLVQMGNRLVISIHHVSSVVQFVHNHLLLSK